MSREEPPGIKNSNYDYSNLYWYNYLIIYSPGKFSKIVKLYLQLPNLASQNQIKGCKTLWFND